MISKGIDKIIIPPFLKIQTLFWLKRFPELSFYAPKQVFLEEGHQTRDYLRHCANKYYPINNSLVLLVGCGKGEEVKTWIPWNPNKIVGIDYFDYSGEWAVISKALPKDWRERISFWQLDILSNNHFLNGPFDIISSDAVFEHITNLNQALSNLSKLLRSSGILYADLGPLYYAFGGDHYSGWDGVENGFNHLLLEKEDYGKYLTQRHNDKLIFDDRIFIRKDLFSYLKLSKYLEVFKEHFHYLELNIGISSNALKFRKLFPRKWKFIIERHKLQEIDLIVKCIFITASKSAINRRNTKLSASPLIGN